MMNELFRAVVERLRIVFTAHAALDIEAEMIARHIERKAALLRQAAQLETEGLTDLAAEVRQAAGRMDPRRPAESVLPVLDTNAITDTSGTCTDTANGSLPLLAPTSERNGTGADRPAVTNSRKKSR